MRVYFILFSTLLCALFVIGYKPECEIEELDTLFEGSAATKYYQCIRYREALEFTCPKGTVFKFSDQECVDEVISSMSTETVPSVKLNYVPPSILPVAPPHAGVRPGNPPVIYPHLPPSESTKLKPLPPSAPQLAPQLAPKPASPPSPPYAPGIPRHGSILGIGSKPTAPNVYPDVPPIAAPSFPPIDKPLLPPVLPPAAPPKPS